MALTPTMQVGSQLREVLTIHRKYQDRLDKRILELFEDVRLPNPKEIKERYPHQLSGGQQQRIAIAMALSCDPELLLLDEPTTDLDVTTQAQILHLLVQLRSEHGMAMLYVTHNLGVLAQISDRAAIMYAGKLVEIASTDEIFKNPCHPYTRGLIASVPRIDTPTRTEQKLRGFLRRSELPPGCRFAPRCDESQSICFEEPVSLIEVLPGHYVACRCCSKL
jgi:peptide/nickel transport system ATP-binding protein